MRSSTIYSGILLGIIIFVIILIPVFIFAILPRVAKRFNVKTNFMIAVCYLALLILLSLVSFALPGCALVKAQNTSLTVDNGSKTDIINKMASEGNFSTPEGYKKIESSFVPNGSSVSVMSENFGVRVIAKTKGVDIADNGDGKIDVYCYMPEHSYFNGIDYASKAGAPTVEYSGDKITVKSNSQPILNMYEFNDEYSARQFFNIGTDFIQTFSESCSNAIVVALPRGVKVTESGADQRIS